MGCHNLLGKAESEAQIWLVRYDHAPWFAQPISESYINLEFLAMRCHGSLWFVTFFTLHRWSWSLLYFQTRIKQQRDLPDANQTNGAELKRHWLPVLDVDGMTAGVSGLSRSLLHSNPSYVASRYSSDMLKAPSNSSVQSAATSGESFSTWGRGWPWTDTK